MQEQSEDGNGKMICYEVASGIQLCTDVQSDIIWVSGIKAIMDIPIMDKGQVRFISEKIHDMVAIKVTYGVFFY